MIKVIVISHALVQEAARVRWRLLAEHHGADVTLLVPAYWESTWFGELTSWRPQPINKERFRVIPIPVTNSHDWNHYLFRSVDARLRDLQPDIIFVAQEESTRVLHQMILYRRLWAPKAKLLFFTWNNLGIPRNNWKQRLMWWNARTGTDAAVAGNHEIKQVLRAAGYVKPIKVQTEIGVDEAVFKPDPQLRELTQARLGLAGFVIGYAGRLTAAKGLRDLFRALSGLSGDWSLLLVGDGDLRPQLEAEARHMSYNVHFTGMVDMASMPDYFNAMDCLVLPSRTMPDWKEQFGLVLLQAMACHVPVIGSDSGAIPEVIGNGGLIFPEDDDEALSGHLQRLQSDTAFREKLAGMGYARCLSEFSASALAQSTFSLFEKMLDPKQSVR